MSSTAAAPVTLFFFKGALFFRGQNGKINMLYVSFRFNSILPYLLNYYVVEVF